MFGDEGVQGGTIFLNECRVGWADRILTGGLLDWSSVLVDDDPFPVRRFIAHDEDIAFETRNIFRDERLVLRWYENPVTDRIDARRHRIELDHDVPAIGSFQDRVIIPGVLVIKLRVGLLRMHNDGAAGRPESIEKRAFSMWQPVKKLV